MAKAKGTATEKGTGTTSKALCKDGAVPRMTRLGRRATPLSIALTAWDLWRRLPPRQRKQMLDLARKHGPTVAARVVKARAAYKNRRPPKP
jgi:hypothetical protein